MTTRGGAWLKMAARGNCCVCVVCVWVVGGAGGKYELMQRRAKFGNEI